VTKTLLAKPDDPIPFMVEWLIQEGKVELPEMVQLRHEVEQLRGQLRLAHTSGAVAPVPAGEGAEEEEEEEDEDDEDDEVDELPELPSMEARMKAMPRTSVSAEAFGAWNKKKAFEAPVYNKSSEQFARLKDILSNSFLFSALNEKEQKTVIFAMQEKVIEAKERPIKQGDDGDCLYVIESGVLDCYKKFDGETEEKLVKTCEVGDVFGELALLYNVPRAASVEARERCVVWMLDRESFNAIVKDAAAKKREMHERFLGSVPLLENMDSYERNKIADALKTETFRDGEYIVKQGDPGDKFYLLEEGEAVALKVFVEGQEEKQVMAYKAGDYFGELALLRNEPRAASVVAKGDTQCGVLDRASFKRLLGPLEQILSRASQRYE